VSEKRKGPLTTEGLIDRARFILSVPGRNFPKRDARKLANALAQAEERLKAAEAVVEALRTYMEGRYPYKIQGYDKFNAMFEALAAYDKLKGGG
jgi:hypothetical protein